MVKWFSCRVQLRGYSDSLTAEDTLLATWTPGMTEVATQFLNSKDLKSMFIWVDEDPDPSPASTPTSSGGGVPTVKKMKLFSHVNSTSMESEGTIVDRLPVKLHSKRVEKMSPTEKRRSNAKR